MGIKEFFDLMKRAFKKWSLDKAGRLAAALSYYSVFSLAPLLVILIAVVGFFYGQAAVEGRLVSEIEGVVGLETAAMIQTMIANTREGGGGLLATVISVILLLFGATGLFSQLQEALNVVWKVQPKPGAGLAGMLKMRLGSFLLVLSAVILLIASLVASTVLTALDEQIASLFPGGNIVFLILNWLLSLTIITVLFALIYKILPDVTLSWREVLPGAIVTAGMFVIGKELIGLYLGMAAAGSAYGAAGSLAVLLLWIFYTAQIFLLGAEFTYLYVQEYGSTVVPVQQAEFIPGGQPIQDRDSEGTAEPAWDNPNGTPVHTSIHAERYFPDDQERVARPRSRSENRPAAQKSLNALSGIVLSLVGFAGAALVRSRRRVPRRRR